MPLNITFRTQLLGGSGRVCHASNLRIFANAINLVEVIVLLAKYKEEGVVLFPEVYVSTDIGALCAMLPEGERLPLGSTRADAFGCRSFLTTTDQYIRSENAWKRGRSVVGMGF